MPLLDFCCPCGRETGAPQNLPSGDDQTAPWFRVIRAMWVSETLRRQLVKTSAEPSNARSHVKEGKVV